MMVTKRALLFFAVCLVVRLAFAVVAKVASQQLLRVLGVLAIVPAIRFMYIYYTGSNPRGAIFGEKAWWDSLRPLHGAMYGLFAVMAIVGYRHAWLVLLADAMIGAAAFVLHSNQLL